MAKDNFFKARMTDEQIQTLESIVREIQADTPEANVTASSIARYALEKYIDEYRAKKNGNKIFIEINTQLIGREDMERLYNLMSDLYKKVKAEESEELSYIVCTIFQKIMSSFAYKFLMPEPKKED